MYYYYIGLMWTIKNHIYNNYISFNDYYILNFSHVQTISYYVNLLYQFRANDYDLQSIKQEVKRKLCLAVYQKIKRE